MNQLDREGQFKGLITEYGLKEMDSGSVAVAIKATLTDLWSGDEWHPWGEYEMEAVGDIWVVKKDGKTLLNRNIEALTKFAGWDGDFMSVVNQTWTPTPCQFHVKAEEYEGRTYYKIAFVNAIDRTPGDGQLGNVDENKAKALATRFGAGLRAIAGNVKRASSIPTPPPKSNGNGHKPPVPRAVETPEPPAEPLPAHVGDPADIPF